MGKSSNIRYLLINKGTVTSVALTVPSILSVSGSPITSSGTIAITTAVTPTGSGALVLQTSPTLITPRVTTNLKFDNAIGKKLVLYDFDNNDHEFNGLGGDGSRNLTYHIGTASKNHVFYAGIDRFTSNELARISGEGNLSALGVFHTFGPETLPTESTRFRIQNTNASLLELVQVRVAGDFSSTSLIGDSVIRNISGNLILQNGTGTSGLRITSSNNVEVRNNLNIISLTASYSVHTDASKNLISVQNSGSGLNLLQTSPTLITPNIGAATGTSLTFGGSVSVFNNPLTINESAHTTSRRAGLSIGDWQIGQDLFVDGTRDFYIYGNSSGSRQFYISPTGLININSLIASRLVLTDASKNLSSLSAGSNGQVLTVVSGAPTWTNPATSGNLFL